MRKKAQGTGPQLAISMAQWPPFSASATYQTAVQAIRGPGGGGALIPGGGARAWGKGWS